MALKEGVAFFRVSGEWLTEQCRDFVREGEWRRGLRLLVDGLEGLGHDNAIAVLTGEKRLVGVNSVDLMDEFPTVGRLYRAEVAWLFAGIVRVKNCHGEHKFVRPYAYVDHWGPHDILESVVRRNRFLPPPGRGLAGPKLTGEERSVRYMDDPRDDVAMGVEHPDLGDYGKVVVLWKDARTDPPPWIEVPNVSVLSPREWVDPVGRAIEAGYHLERRGHNWYAERHPDEEADQRRRYEVTGGPYRELKKTPLDEYRANKGLTEEELPDPGEGKDATGVEMLTKMAIAQGINPAAAVGLAVGLTGGDESEEDPKPDPNFHHDHGWITGDGRFWGCLYFGHKTLAVRMIRMFQGKELGPAEADTEAGRLNWVRISSSADTGEPKIEAHGGRVTEKQKETVRAWCAKHRANPADFDILAPAE
jgi:hypothetical protein